LRRINARDQPISDALTQEMIGEIKTSLFQAGAQFGLR
jgi:hypothetical protein